MRAAAVAVEVDGPEAAVGDQMSGECRDFGLELASGYDEGSALGRSVVASAIRAGFEQPAGVSAREQLDRLIDGMAGRYPRVAGLLTEAKADPLADLAFPVHERSRESRAATMGAVVTEQLLRALDAPASVQAAADHQTAHLNDTDFRPPGMATAL